MKATLLTILGILFFASTSLANPFLVCDPQANTDSFVLTFDGVEETISYQEIVFADGTYALLKDLAGISEGQHSVTVYAKNIWGQSVAVPFAFQKSLPSDPSGIGLK